MSVCLCVIAGFLTFLLSQLSHFECLELWLSLVSCLRFRLLQVYFVMHAAGAAVQTLQHNTQTHSTSAVLW